MSENLPTQEEIKIEMSLEELDHILSTTIKGDFNLKMILFLCSLLTFTKDDQVNFIITGESSIGKTYNINEVLWYFPEDIVNAQAGASPKSFIHKKSARLVDVRDMKVIDPSDRPKKGDPKEKFDLYYEKMRNSGYFLDYSQKIFVFPDMPNTYLLQALRPILSHDKEISKYEITEKTNYGFKTKSVFIKGFFTSIFASANTNIDEQEASRHFLLSPTDDPDKIQEALNLIVRKNSDVGFHDFHEHDRDRVLLKLRVSTIQKFGCEKIMIPKELLEDLKNWFISKTVTLNPKLQRDFPRLIDLVKALTLFNWCQRIQSGLYHVLEANKTDIENAKSLYEKILNCNELGLTPEEFDVWKMVENIANNGLSIRAIHDTFYSVKKRNISDKRLRGMLQNFCRAGLLREEKDGRSLKYYSVNQKEESKPEPISEPDQPKPEQPEPEQQDQKLDSFEGDSQ